MAACQIHPIDEQTVGWYRQRHVREHSSPWRVPVENITQLMTIFTSPKKFLVKNFGHCAPLNYSLWFYERKKNEPFLRGRHQTRYPDRSDKAFLMTSFFWQKVVYISGHFSPFFPYSYKKWTNLLNYWFSFAQGNLSIKLIDSLVLKVMWPW